MFNRGLPTYLYFIINCMFFFVQYQINKSESLIQHIVASELNDPICHSDECQIGSFSSEATILCLLGLHAGILADVNIDKLICIHLLDCWHQMQHTTITYVSMGLKVSFVNQVKSSKILFAQ